MKPNLKQINQKLILTIGVASIVILMLIKVGLFNYKFDNDDNFNGVYNSFSYRLDTLNNELSVATNKLDSLKRVKESYIDGGTSYSGFMGVLGIGKLADEQSGEDQSYVSFGNIGLKINEDVSRSHLSFHTVNGQGYLSRMKFTKTSNDTNISVVDTKVNYRYNSQDNNVMARVNSKILGVMLFVIVIAIWVFYLSTFLYVLFSFFKFLLSISRNEAFAFENIIRLKYMAIALCLMAVSPFLINGIIYLAFISIYSGEGVQLTYSFLKYDVYYLMLAILSYIIYAAFKHGMILQQEQELTI
jgi:hypothetical protein